MGEGNERLQNEKDKIKCELESKQKKTAITLAINQDVLNNVKEEADSEKTSLSSKVSDILLRHIVTYRFSRDMKSIFISEKTFRLIIDKIDEDLLLDDFTNNALDFIPTLFYAKNISFTIDNIIRYALTGAGLHGGIYNHFHHHKDSQGFTILVMRHNFGLKWSKVLSKGLTKLLHDTLGCISSSIILPSSIIIKVPQSE